MSIAIRYTEGDHCPVFVCDQCGFDIGGEWEGIYTWDPIEGNGPFAISTLHKGRCDELFNGDGVSMSGGSCWNSLKDLPRYLAHNLGPNRLLANELDESKETA